jgi:hypothetical protein
METIYHQVLAYPDIQRAYNIIPNSWDRSLPFNCIFNDTRHIFLTPERMTSEVRNTK